MPRRYVMVIQMMSNGWLEVLKMPVVCHFGAQMKFLCLVTYKRWMWQYLMLDYVRKLSKTGRRKAPREIKWVILLEFIVIY